MIVDVNVNLSRWPTRRLPCDETPHLVARLRERGIAQAWAGSFDGLLYKDLAAVNSHLAGECERYGEGLLVPFGSVNPTLPDWRDDVRRCVDDHKMPGIRLHPNYHGYQLDQPVFREVLELSGQHGLIVQLAVKMEDERTQHRLCRVEPVDVSPLRELLVQHPGLKLVILNGLRTIRGEDLTSLSAAGNVWFEISMLEGVGGIERLLEQVPLEQIVFGSHFPFFYLDSALLKIGESELSAAQRDAIRHGNAVKLLGQKK